MDSYNTFNSLRPDFKDTYADDKKKRFSRTRNSLKKGISKNMLEASKNPQKWLHDNENININGLKGIV